MGSKKGKKRKYKTKMWQIFWHNQLLHQTNQSRSPVSMMSGSKSFIERLENKLSGIQTPQKGGRPKKGWKNWYGVPLFHSPLKRLPPTPHPQYPEFTSSRSSNHDTRTTNHEPRKKEWTLEGLKSRPRFSEKRTGVFVWGIGEHGRWQKVRSDPDLLLFFYRLAYSYGLQTLQGI